MANEIDEKVDEKVEVYTELKDQAGAEANWGSFEYYKGIVKAWILLKKL